MSIQNFQTFCDKMQSSIQEYYGEGVEVKLQEVEKNNGIKLMGMTIHQPGVTVLPTMYLESFYELYQDNMAFSQIVSLFIEKYEASRKDEVDINFFSDYEKVKKLLFYKLVHYEMNREFLKKVPHERYLDLAVIFQCHISNEILGSGTVTVRREHLKLWNITEERLFKDAKENMPRLYPAEFLNMAEVLMQLYQGEKEVVEDELPLYVLSNHTRLYGAASLLYEKQLEKIGEQLQDDYYILPSSIHEVLILPKKYGTDENELSQMVDDINHTHVEREEILSNHAYFYARGSKQPVSLPLIPGNRNACN